MSIVAETRRGPEPQPPSAIDSIREMIRGELHRVSEKLSRDGGARPALDGKLLRPLMAYLVVPPAQRRGLDDRFWSGALAIEMAHEASLLHDDVVDEAPQRRGRPTVFSKAGVGAALVLGDHLLTSSYRAAAGAESQEFLATFIRSVERTVAGELAQGRSRGTVLTRPEYERIITGKSGEFFRCAISLGTCLDAGGGSAEAGDLGARIGRLYQMIDDFLDYCPSLDRGKPPLQDWRQEKWTWPLGLLDEWAFSLGEMDLLDRLYKSHPGRPSAMEKGAAWVRQEVGDLLDDLAAEGLEAKELREVFESWADLVDRSFRQEATGGRVQVADDHSDHRTSAPDFPGAGILGGFPGMAGGLDTATDRRAYFGHHARSFRFASRVFSQEDLDRVSEVYAFCRFTDDLVDEAQDSSPRLIRARLEEWRVLAREAYRHGNTAVAVLDAAMGTMRERGIPFHYADDLISGVGMDIEPRSFPTLDALRVYSYRVAGTVGGWMTELFGCRDPWVLERAFSLGHAMQLTNILRDVGEDLERGRVYLPLDRMAAHRVDRSLLQAGKKVGSTAFPGYQALLEELMSEADRDYARAWVAMPSLPRAFRTPVAIAAAVYRGIHDEIRRNRYDNLSKRAATTGPRKVVLAGRALWRLLRAPTHTAPEGEMVPSESGSSSSEAAA